MNASSPDPSEDLERVDAAVALARRLLVESSATETGPERRRRERLGRLIEDPAGRSLVFALTDEVIRIDDDGRAAERFAAIVATHRTSALGRIDRALLAAGGRVARLAPRLTMPLIRRRIAAETRGIVLPAEDRPLGRHLQRRRSEGVRININPLGEAVLSDRDAQDRVEQVLGQIERHDVDYVSIKISAVVANLDPLAFDHSIGRIVARLREIYRAAQHASPRTFVNLDMEEYGDLELSLASFMQVLDEPEFAPIDAGIVLQAYLPDAHEALDRLARWAVRRRARGGGTIKVRLVKGANLAMEQVEAEQHGWVAAPYPTKADVDASYKAILDRALAPEFADGLRVGVASHNLFDVAWAFLSARDAGALGRVEFEMLEGMAPSQARSLHELAGGLLMYAPVVRRDDFDASIAYLARRLDENTQPANFLRSLFSLRPDSAEWDAQERRFRDAVARRGEVSTARRRGPNPAGAVAGFTNEADSDFTDGEARRAAVELRPRRVPVDELRDRAAVDAAMARACDAAQRWSRTAGRERRDAIGRAADQMRRERFETIAVMADETGKTIAEADPEVSEAIDFATYYSGPGIDLHDELTTGPVGVEVSGRGVVAVIGPWNFPYAIPAGGTFAALAAGNAVVLKPAPEAVQVAATFVDQLHRSGLDPDLVQLMVCDDGPIGRHLVTHDDVDTVVLTGAYETATMFLGWKPDLRLFAETSGKNALVITTTADLDLALDDLVRSAFGHAGQKCSAASLGIVEAPVYDDPEFHRRLRDIVRSRRVGWPQDPATIVGPVIVPPTGKLERALTSLEPGERWLVEPEPLDDSRRLWRPGVRVDVAPGSWFHRTECFGPVLGLMRARDLDHAIEIQNDSDYGLTGGIHSLDPDEIDRWCERVQVGNAYVNRHITGAVVRRQPFGGWKRSSIGPGAKAGGPNYVVQFSRLEERPGTAPDAVDASYEAAWRDIFSTEVDPSELVSEANVLRYRPVRRMVVRHDGTQPEALRRLAVAARLSGVDLVRSHSDDDDDEAFLRSLRDDDRVRLVGGAGAGPDGWAGIRRRLVERGIWYDDAPPSPHGRVELLRWTREQAISRTLHRHGRIDRTDGIGLT